MDVRLCKVTSALAIMVDPRCVLNSQTVAMELLTRVRSVIMGTDKDVVSVAKRMLGTIALQLQVHRPLALSAGMESWREMNSVITRILSGAAVVVKLMPDSSAEE